MKEKIKILNPQDCVSVLCKYSRMKQEHFGVIFLNLKKEVIQTKCFFVGSDDSCNSLDMAMLFDNEQDAIKECKKLQKEWKSKLKVSFCEILKG